jgi:hypothetical protein
MIIFNLFAKRVLIILGGRKLSLNEGYEKFFEREGMKEISSRELIIGNCKFNNF